MKYTRLIIGVAIIIVAGWIIIGEQITGVSANAVVNAPLSTARAPIAGQLSLPDRGLGAPVSDGKEIATVTDARVDRVRLDDLLIERAFADAEQMRLESQIEKTEAVMQRLEARSEQFTAARIDELETRLSHARARLDLLQAGLDGDAMIDGLLEDGQLQDLGDPRVPGSALEYARERVAVLEIELATAQDGVFLGDGYNDAPNAEQRRVELETMRDDQVARLSEAKARLQAIDDRIDRERLRVNRAGVASLPAPVDGQVWEVLASDGEYVQRGDAIVRLLDCRDTMVTLSVTESVYNDLRVGDEARFRLSGGGEAHPGTVLRLAGSGAGTFYRNLAVSPSQLHLESYDVTILVPALREDADPHCAVGRTGQAFFERRPLDWLRGLWN